MSLASTRTILYVLPLWPGCARVRRLADELGLDLELRDLLTSGQAREELREAAGGMHVPCLVHGITVIKGAGAIEKYLRLRYGK